MATEETVIRNEYKQKILDILNDFGVITRDQVIALCDDGVNPDASSIGANIIKTLLRTSTFHKYRDDVYVNWATLQRYGSQYSDIVEGDIKTLWVYIDYMQTVGVRSYFFNEGNPYIKASLEMEDGIYEVIFVPKGQEITLSNAINSREKYLTEEQKEETNRIVILEDFRQAPDIRLIGIRKFVVIDDAGNSQYKSPDEVLDE